VAGIATALRVSQFIRIYSPLQEAAISPVRHVAPLMTAGISTGNTESHAPKGELRWCRPLASRASTFESFESLRRLGRSTSFPELPFFQRR